MRVARSKKKTTPWENNNQQHSGIDQPAKAQRKVVDCRLGSSPPCTSSTSSTSSLISSNHYASSNSPANSTFSTFSTFSTSSTSSTNYS